MSRNFHKKGREIVSIPLPNDGVQADAFAQSNQGSERKDGSLFPIIKTTRLMNPGGFSGIK
jgi:hypothetical protein